MKKRVSAAILFLTAAILSAEVPNFGDIKVKLSFEHAPTYRTRTGGVINGGGLFDNEQYLAVEVVFNPGVIFKTDTNRKGKVIASPQAKANAWLDDVRMDVLIAYPEIPGRTRKETYYGLFSGSTVFWSIPLDGKKHVATMFVPPHLLARYTNIKARSPHKNNGKPPRASYRLSPRDFFVEVIFTCPGTGELGRGYCNVDGARTLNERDSHFRRLENAVGKRKIDGAVFPRSRSPWALINPERFDLIVPAARQVQTK